MGGTEGGWDNPSVPPPPDNFPADWDQEWQPSFETAEIAARPEPAARIESPAYDPPHDLAEEPPAPVRPEAALQTAEVSPLPAEPEPQLPPSLYVPLAKEEDAQHQPKQITVILRSTGDKERDKRRIKTIYGTLISYHGRDKFSFHVFENGKGHLIDFPSDTTRICPEMLERLKKLMGEESWRVEEITFQ